MQVKVPAKVNNSSAVVESSGSPAEPIFIASPQDGILEESGEGEVPVSQPPAANVPALPSIDVSCGVAGSCAGSNAHSNNLSFGKIKLPAETTRPTEGEEPRAEIDEEEENYDEDFEDEAKA